MKTNNLILQRYSPFAFSDKDVATEELQQFLEAARWAPSSFNEQPWRFLITTKSKPSEYEKLLECLFDGNKSWAKSAPALMLVMAKRNFTHNDKPNPTHLYDTGMAVQNFILAALEANVLAHQMGGFDHELVRKHFNISEEYSLIAVLAMGYLGDASQLPEDIKRRAERPRVRKPISEIVF